VDVDPALLLEALQTAAETLGVGIFAARVDVSPPRIVYANGEAARLVGRAREEVLGAPIAELVAMFERSRLSSLIESRGVDAPPMLVEYTMQRPDGSLLPIEAGVARVRAGDGLLSVAYVRDVSARHAAVDALRESEQRFRSVVEGAPDGVVLVKQGKIAFLNVVAAHLLGLDDRESGIGRDLFSLMPPDEGARAAERIGEMFRTGRPPPPSEYLSIVAGEERYVEIKSILVEYEGQRAVLAFARDVTERRRLERDLVRADRLAAVGTLAAAVAHEINNPLTYAHLSLQHLERELSKTPEDPRAVAMLEHVRNARHGAERVATIVRDLRTFARVEDDPPGPVDVTGVVERALKIAENELRHHAKLVRKISEVALVDGNASRLEQVFLNLIINAIQALPHGDPNKDSITVEIHPGVAGSVVVAVVDTGPGIPPHVRERVFDPFFTTKPVGEGTGLGLSVCRSIVEGLGGRITIESAPGAGTRVEVTLREHQRQLRVEPVREPVVALATHDGPSMHVLVVDDEPLVRRVLSMVLEPYHEVTCVEDGIEALEALDDQPPYDVILCDLMMPGMNGREVHDEIRRRRPGMERRIVFVTGGAFVPHLAEFLEAVDNLKLLKPFDVQQVLAAVRIAADR
jgi:PAS domain S-box-containing protein